MKIKVRDLIKQYIIPCTYENHPNCPKCNSSNTEIRIEKVNTDYIHRPMQYPVCKDCGYSGMMAFESIHWAGAIVNGIFCQTKEEALEALTYNKQTWYSGKPIKVNNR